MKINNISFECASWTNSIQSSPINRMFDITKNPEMIPFALGLPDPNLFPINEYKTSIYNVIQSTPNAFQYSPQLLSLKEHIVQLMATRGVKCTTAQIFLTGGAQQGISLLSKLLLDRNSIVATSSLTYPCLLQQLASFEPEIIGIPINIHTGLCLDTLERVFSDAKRKPKFFYINSEGHNPLGITLSNEQKKKIAELGCQYKVPIIEDDCYGFLNYNIATKPMRAYEDQWVFYIGTFSKIFSPAFRVGWIIVPTELITKLSFIKEGLDIDTANFSQRIIDDLLSRNILSSHIDNIRTSYMQKRDAMLKSINSYFPKNVSISSPTNGFFIWVELPPNLDQALLLHNSIANNITFLPGLTFSCNHQLNKAHGIRLSFSHPTIPTIEMGIKKLGEIIANSL